MRRGTASCSREADRLTFRGRQATVLRGRRRDRSSIRARAARRSTIRLSTPEQVNTVPAVQALLPAVTIRDDGTIGVLYYDMRNNTSDPGTLLVDAWLATSKDRVVWQETHAGGPFNFANAPMADGGLFIGDYQALASDSQAFYPFFAMANASATNRTDIFASAFR